MAAEIGSTEWIEKSNATLARLKSGVSQTPATLILDVEIRSTNGDVSFSLVVDDGTARIQPRTGVKSTLTLVVNLQTATDISNGTRSVADAIAEGEIKIRGDFTRLMASNETVTDLATALASILA